jgi:hypothetical protein
MVSRIDIVRKLLLAVVLATLPASAITVDRIAAVIDRQVITVSEIAQMVEIRFFPRLAPNEDEHRREVLNALVAQALRYRDVERFGAQDIPPDTIEARVVEIRKRFATEAEFTAALARAELTLDEVRALARRQLQVEAYIQERFAPLVFVSNEEIAEYHATTWSRARRDRGLAVLPLNEVREEVRTAVRSSRLQTEVEKWTTQLRARANVDVYAWR